MHWNTELRYHTGAKAFEPTEYSFGKDDRIIRTLDLDKMFKENDPKLDTIASAVFIQCVGSREPERPYCSRSAVPIPWTMPLR